MKQALKRGAAAALLLLIAATVPASAQQLQKVRVALGSGAFFFSLHYIAEAGGFFKQEGLESETIDLVTGPRQTAAVMGGSVDVALEGLQLIIQATMRGGDIVAICMGYQIMPISLVLSNDAITKTGITDAMAIDERVKRMRGLRLGVTTPGSGSDDMAHSLFKLRGMDPDKDVTLLPVGGSDSMLAATQKGTIDGFFYTSPVPEIAAQRHIGRIVVEPLNGDLPEVRNVPYIIVATSRDTLAKKHDLLLGVVRAYTKAMAYVRQHPDEASKLVHKYFPDVESDVFNAAFAKYTKGLPTSPLITPAEVSDTITWMNVAKKTPITGKYDDVVDMQIANQVLKEVGSH